jgi:cytochrome c556
LSEGFVPGSQEGDTRAKSGIWEDAARFRRLGEQFQTESARVIERSRQGDPALLKAQLDAMGKACKACHDDFKKS